MHGDAAFSGQGVVAETLELSQLRGYRTGGTVHVVVNNQVGFTTAPAAARSSVYATDVARAVQAPIFHVNGDDPEAVVRVARESFEFRRAFKKDVVIDLVCYRRRGHNEADDPSLTQPLMYNLIDAKRSTRKLYTEALIGRGDITVEEAEGALRDYQQQLEKVFRETREAAENIDDTVEPASEVEQRGEVTLAPQTPERDVVTAVSQEAIDRVVQTQLQLPAGFTVHPRLAPQLQRRAQMVKDGTIDWAMGETLAIGSLLSDGISVRMAGQDTRRGTFGQRHMVIIDRQTGWAYKPLKRCYEKGAKLFVYDSPLSEFAAMGFEYGYSVARPEALVLWEAQFGDFANGAQTIIDEFLAPGEQKWGQQSGLVLLLPHGHEGQGPDHSSARIERFLQLCAQDNMTIANLTTPANYFHLLRWQALSPVRRPLVVFTPKSMLRLKAARVGHVRLHLRPLQPGLPRRLVRPRRGSPRPALQRQGVLRPRSSTAKRHGQTDTAVVRVERLYPLPTNETFRAIAQVRPRRASVGAGRAGQPGGLALHGSGPHRSTGPADPTGHPAGQLSTGHRLHARARARAAPPRRARFQRGLGSAVYFTDRGIEELVARRGDEQVSLAWLAAQMQVFVDLTPRLRGSGRAACHLACPCRRRGLNESLWCQGDLAGNLPARYTETRRIATQ